MERRIRAVFGNRWGQALIIGPIVGLLILAVVLIYRSQRQETIILNVQEALDPSVVRVYVGGEVRQPGLYTLARGSRVGDAIAAAGGTTEVADVSTLGLAAVLEDADQIIIGARAAVPPVSGGATDATAEGGPAPTGIININTASAEELEQLPEIGPAIAGRIVEHRERNGPFRSVDELAAIDGISERMVDELRALISVGP